MSPLKANEQWLLLDTCILHHLTVLERSAPVRTLIQDAVGRGFAPALSDVASLEVLSGANTKKSLEIESLLKELNTFPVEHEVVLLAASLGTCYNDHEKVKSHAPAISVPDRIIAATAVLNGGQVLTEDVNDFPWPFFTETETLELPYVSKKGKKQLFHLAFLQPNITAIQDFLDRYDEEKNDFKENKTFEPITLSLQKEVANVLSTDLG